MRAFGTSFEDTRSERGVQVGRNRLCGTGLSLTFVSNGIETAVKVITCHAVIANEHTPANKGEETVLVAVGHATLRTETHVHTACVCCMRACTEARALCGHLHRSKAKAAECPVSR